MVACTYQRLIIKLSHVRTAFSKGSLFFWILGFPMDVLSFGGGPRCSASTASSFHPCSPPSPSHFFTKHRPTLASSQAKPVPTSLIADANALLSSSAKSKPLDQTLHLFHLLPDHRRDTVTWNTVISACLRHGHFPTVIRFFRDMLLSDTSPPTDNITLLSVLKACVELGDFEMGQQVHGYVMKLQGMVSEDQTVMGTSLVKLYGSFGYWEVAHQVFYGIPLKDPVAFTSMMVAFTQAGEYRKALLLFVDMLENYSDLNMNEYVFSCALHASAGGCLLSEGKQIHAHIVKLSLGSDVYVGTSLIDMYTAWEDMESARTAFVDITDKNVVSWNARMAGSLDGDEVLELFSEMRSLGVSPDHVTFAIALRACRGFDFHFARQIHGLVVKSSEAEADVFIGEALLAIYMDHGCFYKARKIFDEVNDKDITAFTLAIQGCCQNGCIEEAVKLLYEALQTLKELSDATITSLMPYVRGSNQGKQLHALAAKLGFCSGSANSHISSSLVKMYSMYQCFNDAVQVFEQISSPDVALWTSLISGFSQNERSQEAFHLYVRMLCQGLPETPNHYTFSTLLNSCANLVAAEEGKQIHAQIIRSSLCIECDQFVASALLHMYAKCGYMEEARRIFANMSHRDLPAWNAMITGLAEHGLARAAIETFHELLNCDSLEPNHVTFLGVLSACSHCGMVETGYHYFRSIKEPNIEHYACLINLVARAGRLKEAAGLIDEMPFHPNELTWSSLLAASSIHGDTEMGKYSAERLLELNPKDPGTYIALSNIYAIAGRWDDVKKIRKLLKDLTITKDPGCSWLSIDGKRHVFFADHQKCL